MLLCKGKLNIIYTLVFHNLVFVYRFPGYQNMPSIGQCTYIIWFLSREVEETFFVMYDNKSAL